MSDLKDTFSSKETSLKKRNDRIKAQSEGGEDGAGEEDFETTVEKVVMKCDDSCKVGFEVFEI